MQLVRTLHSQATEKSFFVLRLNTWNTLSRGASLGPQCRGGSWGLVTPLPVEGQPAQSSAWPSFCRLCCGLQPHGRGNPASAWKGRAGEGRIVDRQHSMRQNRRTRVQGWRLGTQPPAPILLSPSWSIYQIRMLAVCPREQADAWHGISRGVQLWTASLGNLWNPVFPYLLQNIDFLLENLVFLLLFLCRGRSSSHGKECNLGPFGGTSWGRCVGSGWGTNSLTPPHRENRMTFLWTARAHPKADAGPKTSVTFWRYYPTFVNIF